MIKNKGVAIILYLLSSGFSLIVAIPLFKILSHEIDRTFSINTLLSDFDYVAFSDFIRFYGDKLRTLIPLAALSFLLYALFYNFFLGGIIDATKNGHLKFLRFLIFSKRYFWKNLLISLLVWIFWLGFISGIILLIYFLEESIKSHTYRGLILKFLPAVILFILGQTYFMLASNYAKVMLHNGSKPLRSFFAASRLILTNIKPWLVYAGLVSIGIMAGILYFHISDSVGTVAIAGLIASFILQQLLVLFRSFLKIYHFRFIASFTRKPTTNHS